MSLLENLFNSLDLILKQQNKISEYIDSIDLTTLGFEELPIKDKLKLYQDMLGYNKSVTDMVLEILKTKTILTEKEIVFLNLFNKLPDKSQKSLLLKLEDKVNGK